MTAFPSPLRLPAAWTAVLAACLLAGCAATPPQAPITPLGQTSFSDYQRETRAWLLQHRRFQAEPVADELDWNSPAEWRPQQLPLKGVLLVHGLGDSPWSFTDIARQLVAQGYLVRTVLLPGHGSQPADLLGVDLADWQRVVKEQVAVLATEVPEVVLGGFSTGANLVLSYALDHPEVAGLLLFSPALKSAVPIDWIGPPLARLSPWLRPPDSSQPQQTALRYLNVPTNAFAQFYRSSAAVRQDIGAKVFDRPALLVLAEHDSVVDVAHGRTTFERRFSHPASRLIWYGKAPAAAQPTPPRVLVRSDHLPDERISQFSHMGILFAPDNPLYGRHGRHRLCWNGQKSAAEQACFAGAPVWYSDWGYREANKVHARLTFNPHFDWQAGVMNSVLQASSAMANLPE